MSDGGTQVGIGWTVWLLGVAVPIMMIATILIADSIEGPKTAYVGVLSAIPLFSAVFGTPRQTAFVSAVTWASAFAFGKFASDGNVRAQTVRLVIIAIFGAIAIAASVIRTRKERHLSESRTRASEADALETLARTDLLTGLLNRRGVLAEVDDEYTSVRTVAIFDIDHLKAINDGHGHQVGDDFIRSVGSRIAGVFSSEDVVGRWGGDEFVVILDLPAADGVEIVERVFTEMTSEPFSSEALTIPIGVSVGVSSWPPGVSIETVLATADRSLYTAKSNGRNQVVVAPI